MLDEVDEDGERRWTWGMVSTGRWPDPLDFWLPTRRTRTAYRTVECAGVEIWLGCDWGVPPEEDIPGILNNCLDECVVIGGRSDWHLADPLWDKLRPTWPSERTLRRFLDDFDAFLGATSWAARWTAAVRVARARRVFSLHAFSSQRVLAEIRRRRVSKPWRTWLRTSVFPMALCEALRSAWHPQPVKLGRASVSCGPHWVERTPGRWVPVRDRAYFAPIRFPRVPLFRWLRAATYRAAGTHILAERARGVDLRLPHDLNLHELPLDPASFESHRAHAEVELEQRLARAALTATQQAVIARRRAGRSFAAIAAELGVATSTVRCHLRDAIAKVKVAS